jgi:hypothetical protein
MGAMRDLAVGFATMIADSSIAVYRPDGSPYLASETAIVFKDMAPSPDRMVCLTSVPLTDATAASYGLVLVQVKMRGLPNNSYDVDDLGDAIFDLVQNTRNVTFGSTHAIQILRNSSVPMGVDTSKRWLRTDHYYVDLDFPETANRNLGGWD